MLRVVTGKPGSGKSAHVVKEIANQLTEWARYELHEQQEYERKLYTNLDLNIPALSEWVSKRVGCRYDVAELIHPVKLVGAWWEDIPKGALIVLDEVHEALGAERDYKESIVAFRNYVATHRHYQHDLILISQHIENVSIEILRIAEQIQDIQNFKSVTIPLLNIPVADIDVVRRSFGFVEEAYRVSIGRVVGRSTKFEAATSHVMGPGVWALYNSHAKASTLAGDKQDRPGLRLGPVRSLLWFARRHGLQVGFKVAAVAGIIWYCWSLLDTLPYFVSGVVGGKKAGSSAHAAEPDKVEKPKPELVPSRPEPKPVAVPENDAAGDTVPANVVAVADYAAVSAERDELARRLSDAQERLTRMAEDLRIVAVIPGGVILKSGRRVDLQEEVEFPDGSVDSIEATDSRTGRVEWASGKVEYLR